MHDELVGRVGLFYALGSFFTPTVFPSHIQASQAAISVSCPIEATGGPEQIGISFGLNP